MPMFKKQIASRYSMVLVGLLAMIACKAKVPTALQPTDAPAERQPKRPPTQRAGTVLEGIDTTDTYEDPDYVSAGEAIASKAAANWIGQLAPLAVMKTIEGHTIDLRDAYGTKPVYIKFWATWCVPCRQQMPAFQRLYEAHAADMNFIAVNIGLSDDLASVRGIQKTFGLTMPIVFDDGHIASLFHLAVTPQHILIGRDGRIAYVGHADNKHLADAVDRALSDTSTATPVRAVARKSVTPLGVGDVVPKQTVTTLDGSVSALKASRPGNVRALQFFSSWCEWYLEKTRPVTSQACARTRKTIGELASSHSTVEWLGIAGGPWATVEDLADYKKLHKISMPLALDSSGTLFRTFGIRDIPTIVLVDSTGHIVQTIMPDTADLAEAIHAVSGKEASSK